MERNKQEMKGGESMVRIPVGSIAKGDLIQAATGEPFTVVHVTRNAGFGRKIVHGTDANGNKIVRPMNDFGTVIRF
jgi:hypothetical protein